MTMKSAVLISDPAGRGMKVGVVDGEPPTPSTGELVVEMKACGVCGTDLEKIRGEYTASLPVIGHEAVGVVARVGEGVAGFHEGDRVFPHHHVPCNACYLCRAGAETMCERYRSTSLVPGGFSELFTVPAWNVSNGGVLRLPDDMGFDVASLVEPLACCLRAIERCRVRAGDSVLVAGAGPVGMMHAILLRGEGAEVSVSDVSEARLAYASKLGFSRVLDASHDDVPGLVRRATGGRGADVALVASGNRGAILQGLRSIRKGGVVCLFGVPPVGTTLDYDISELYNGERRVVTSYGATEVDTKEALRILSSRGDEFARLITHRFPISRFQEALDAASGARAMKVVVSP